MTARSRVLQLGLVAIASLLAGFGFSRVFPAAHITLPVAGAAILPPAIEVGTRRRSGAPGLRFGVAAALSGAGLVIFCLVAVERSASPAAWASLLGGAVHGWADILTSSLPAQPTARQLIVVPISVWVGAFFAVQMVWRTQGPLTPSIPLMVEAVVPHLLAAGGPEAHPVLAPTLLLLAIGGIAIVRSAPPKSPVNAHVRARLQTPLRRPASGAVGIWILAALAAPWLTVHLPFEQHRRPFDPRTLRAPQNLQDPTVNPLSEIKGRLESPATPLFTITTKVPAGATPTIRVRLAVLDTYNGATWNGPTSFQTAGTDLAANPDPAQHTVAITQTIKIQQLGGYSIPAADWPAAVRLANPRGGSLAFDPGTGTLVDPSGLTPGVTYAVTEDAPEYSSTSLAHASAVTGPEAAPYLSLPPGRPALFAAVAGQATAGATSDFQKAAALQQFFQTHFTNTVEAAAGHSYARLVAFLSSTPGGYTGTSEQFAAAFAVLARTLGLPTRVAVGFQPSVTGPGTHVVTNADIVAWPEVWFRGQGWTAFDPTPPVGTTAVPVIEPSNSPPLIAQKIGGSSGSTSTSVLPTNPGPVVPVSARGPWWALGIGVAALALALAAAGAGTLVAKRRRRDRLRNAGSPGRRIVGAWSHTVARLRQRGLPPVRSLTATEIAEAGEATVGVTTRALGPLANLVNQTLYSTDPPSPESADEAWGWADDVEAALANQASRLRRIGEQIDPRPLLRR